MIKHLNDILEEAIKGKKFTDGKNVYLIIGVGYELHQGTTKRTILYLEDERGNIKQEPLFDHFSDLELTKEYPTPGDAISEHWNIPKQATS